MSERARRLDWASLRRSVFVRRILGADPHRQNCYHAHISPCWRRHLVVKAALGEVSSITGPARSAVHHRRQMGVGASPHSPNPAQPEPTRLPGLQAPDPGLHEKQFLEPGVWSLKSLPSCTRSRPEGTTPEVRFIDPLTEQMMIIDDVIDQYVDAYGEEASLLLLKTIAHPEQGGLGYQIIFFNPALDSAEGAEEKEAAQSLDAPSSGSSTRASMGVPRGLT
jgi:hypothetical protein